MAVFLRVCAPLLAVASAITLQLDTSAPSEVVADPASQIQAVRSRMMASPHDLEVQRRGCEELQGLADTQREGPGPWGGRKVSTALLEAGLGEALAQGLLHSVAIEHSSLGMKAPGSGSRQCLDTITGLTVQNDYDKGLALISNAPTLWLAITARFEAFKGSSEVNESLVLFAGLFGTPQPTQAAVQEVKAGAIDVVMDYFNESLKSDPEMFQRVFAALSDPVHESSGVVARAIANHGGPLQGIRLMVRALRWARESGSTFHEGNGFGLLYEGVHDVGGILEHDDANRTFAHAFVRAGLVEELVPIMWKEPGDRTLQDMSCEAIKWITDDNVAVQTQLVEMGAMDLMAEALKKHSHPPYLGYCPVTIGCSTALLNFAATSATWRERLRSLGVYDTLDAEVFAAFPATGSNDFIMRAKWFPNSNIYSLKAMLEPSA